ncbi:hypothetical protein [Shouchella patagoniensis]|uniref:hypothetical protein n=1 Tax=Shouchella patagoniensis TaxID=228576 RepID=UPI000995AF12|nr:hypothetical protein [Shouchella patagoniensis]
MVRWLNVVLCVFLLFMTGCSKEGERQLHIMAFSDELYEQQEALKLILAEDDVALTVFPTILERFIVELVGHEADLLLVDGSLAGAIDPEGLAELGELEGVSVPIHEEEEIVALSLQELLVEAVQLEQEHLLLIPVYSDRQQEALAFVKTW